MLGWYDVYLFRVVVVAVLVEPLYQNRDTIRFKYLQTILDNPEHL